MSKTIAIAFVVSAVSAIARAQTLSLEDVVARAIEHSPEVRLLDAAVAEARAGATLADAFHNAATISATPGYATGLPTAVLGQVPAIATVEAHRLLYDLSARSAQIGAESQAEAAVARLESGKREIAQRAAELYAKVAADAKLAESARRRITAYETIAARADALRREGRARDLDVNRATLQVAGAERSAARAQSRFELDRLRFCRMLGETDASCDAADLGGGPAPRVAEAGGPTLDVAQANDPDLRTLDSRIESMRRVAALEGRRFQPSVAAQIQYSRLFDRFRRYYLNFSPDDFSAGATLTVPVWTGGNRAASSARAAAQLQQLIAQRDSRRTEIELSVREAEADLAQALAENELAGRTRAVAADGLRIAQQLAQEGRGEANDIPLAQTALADADDDGASAAAHVAVAHAHLLILRGELPRR